MKLARVQRTDDDVIIDEAFAERSCAGRAFIRERLDRVLDPHHGNRLFARDTNAQRPIGWHLVDGAEPYH